MKTPASSNELGFWGSLILANIMGSPFGYILLGFSLWHLYKMFKE